MSTTKTRKATELGRTNQDYLTKEQCLLIMFIPEIVLSCKRTLGTVFTNPHKKTSKKELITKEQFNLSLHLLIEAIYSLRL